MGMHDPVTVAGVALGVLGVAGLLLAGWRRARALDGSGGRIELVTSRYLGGKRVLTLIDVEGERLLLALSGDTVRLVARIDSRSRPRSTSSGASGAASRPGSRSRPMRPGLPPRPEPRPREADCAREPRAAAAREGVST
jgi:flagellar biogenesis protein FliO